METMTYPCSPLIPFPTQHEESSYLLWSPQLVSHHENADIDDMYDVDPSPDDQRQDHEFLAMVMVQDAHDMRQDDFSNADHPLAVGCEEERLLGQEGGNNLVDTVQEELMVVMEESNLADLLIAGAMAVEAGDSIRVSAIMAKIDDILDGITDGRYDASGSSFDHLACYFARVLRSRIGGARTECHLAAPAEPPPVQPANRLPAYQMLQELSPFVKFAHFTANQAILEATVDEREVHVVDLNIGEGSQWSSLMSDLASRHGGKPFRLTALTTGGTGAGAHRTSAPARWLSEFAGSLGLPFRYDEEDLHEFTGSCCNGGGGSSSVIISCDATGMSHTSMSYSQLMLLLLGSVKIMQPKLVILTEDELFRTGRTPPTLAGASFAEFFGEALRHFAAVQESLASCFCDGGYEVCLRLVEQEILGPRIEGCATWPHWSMTGGARDGDVAAWFLGLGFRACGASGFNIAQARMLAGLFSRGFGVMHDKERLALCWKDRPLTSVSIWSPV